MNSLTNSEMKKWLTGQGMRHQPLECGVPVAGEFDMPRDSASRRELAQDLADLLSKDSTKLVEILAPETAQPEELNALEKFRAQLGEQRPLATAPGFLFKGKDRDAFRDILTLILGFRPGWMLYVYSAPSGNSLFFGGRIRIWATKRGLRNELARRLTPVPRAA